MSTPQDHLRAITFYEYRRGTGATATIRNINDTLGLDSTSISMAGSLTSGEETRTSKTSLVRDVHTVDESAILGAVKQNLDVNMRNFLEDLIPEGESLGSF